VSAVGHEQDTPLSDLVADARASTPSAAARLVVPDLDELLQRLDRSRAELARATQTRVTRDRERVDRARLSLHRATIQRARDSRTHVERAHERLRRAPLLDLERRRARLEQSAGRLRALSPRATLARGYAVVRAEGRLVREAATLTPGDAVDVEVVEGSFGARVEDVRP
jgi:exodeoxyribonuclease VII large subunit